MLHIKASAKGHHFRLGPNVKNIMMCKDQHTQTDVQIFENGLVSVTSLNGLLLHTTI